MGVPRLIATDLDGTLIGSDGTVSERTRRALRGAQDKGAEIVLVTARPPRYVDRLGLDAGLAATAGWAHGAVVYDPRPRALVQGPEAAPPVPREGAGTP